MGRCYVVHHNNLAKNAEVVVPDLPSSREADQEEWPEVHEF